MWRWMKMPWRRVEELIAQFVLWMFNRAVLEAWLTSGLELQDTGMFGRRCD